MKKLVLLVLVFGACAKTESDSILTSGMHASIAAVSDGSTTKVTTTLFQGQPLQLIFIELTGDDQLIAWHGEESKVMTETELLNVVGHHATFAAGAEGDEFEVELRRTVDDGAPSSIATLPAAFTMDPPPASASRGGDLTLTWSPGGSTDRMEWSADGDCIEPSSGTITADAGTITIAAGAIQKRMNQQQVPDSCIATLHVDRKREGSVDPAYGKGGTFFGIQRRTVTFTTTP